MSPLPVDSVSVGQRGTGGHQIRGLSLHSDLHGLATLLVRSFPSVSGLDPPRTGPPLGGGVSLEASGWTFDPERTEEQPDRLVVCSGPQTKEEGRTAGGREERDVRLRCGAGGPKRPFYGP